MFTLIREGFNGGKYVARCLTLESLMAACRLLGDEAFSCYNDTPRGTFHMWLRKQPDGTYKSA